MRAPLALLILVTFFITSVVGPLPANADEFVLPKPGVMIHLSPPMNPPMLKGIKVHTDNPFRFDFILDKGDTLGQNDPERAKRDEGLQLKEESTKLIKYFLASLTIPEKDLWVNLSPYEKDRIVPESFGVTEMGRDLLAEDYMLKQITASLIYPEGETGKKFWKRIYEEAQKKYGNTNIPVNTFNKVWIVPEKAVVYENAKAGTAYVVESKLKVMLEADYLSLEKHENVGAQFIAPTTKGLMNQTPTDVNQIGSQIVREILIPELTREVNEGKNFAQLRQVYNSLILATWYKKKIKDSILEQVYADRNKTKGIGINDQSNVESIYQRYLQAFKKGVYNYIKEEPDPITNQTTPRKYFSGGTTFNSAAMNAAMKETTSAAMLPSPAQDTQYLEKVVIYPQRTDDSSAAMNVVDPLLIRSSLGYKHLSDEEYRELLEYFIGTDLEGIEEISAFIREPNNWDPNVNIGRVGTMDMFDNNVLSIAFLTHLGEKALKGHANLNKTFKGLGLPRNRAWSLAISKPEQNKLTVVLTPNDPEKVDVDKEKYKEDFNRLVGMFQSIVSKRGGECEIITDTLFHEGASMILKPISDEKKGEEGQTNLSTAMNLPATPVEPELKELIGAKEIFKHEYIVFPNSAGYLPVNDPGRKNAWLTALPNNDHYEDEIGRLHSLYIDQQHINTLRSVLEHAIPNAKDAIFLEIDEAGSQTERDAYIASARITISAYYHPDENKVIFILSDNGGGIPTDVLEHWVQEIFKSSKKPIVDPFDHGYAGGRGVGISLILEQISQPDVRVTFETKRKNEPGYRVGLLDFPKQLFVIDKKETGTNLIITMPASFKHEASREMKTDKSPAMASEASAAMQTENSAMPSTQEAIQSFKKLLEENQKPLGLTWEAYLKQKIPSERKENRSFTKLFYEAGVALDQFGEISIRENKPAVAYVGSFRRAMEDFLKTHFDSFEQQGAPTAESIVLYFLNLALDDQLPKNPTGPKQIIGGVIKKGLSPSTFLTYLPTLAAQIFKPKLDQWIKDHEARASRAMLEEKVVHMASKLIDRFNAPNTDKFEMVMGISNKLYAESLMPAQLRPQRLPEEELALQDFLMYALLDESLEVRRHVVEMNIWPHRGKLLMPLDFLLENLKSPWVSYEKYEYPHGLDSADSSSRRIWFIKRMALLVLFSEMGRQAVVDPDAPVLLNNEKLRRTVEYIRSIRKIISTELERVMKQVGDDIDPFIQKATNDPVLSILGEKNPHSFGELFLSEIIRYTYQTNVLKQEDRYENIHPFMEAALEMNSNEDVKVFIQRLKKRIMDMARTGSDSQMKSLEAVSSAMAGETNAAMKIIEGDRKVDLRDLILDPNYYMVMSEGDRIYVFQDAGGFIHVLSVMFPLDLNRDTVENPIKAGFDDSIYNKDGELIGHIERSRTSDVVLVNSSDITQEQRGQYNTEEKSLGISLGGLDQVDIKGMLDVFCKSGIHKIVASSLSDDLEKYFRMDNGFLVRRMIVLKKLEDTLYREFLRKILMHSKLQRVMSGRDGENVTIIRQAFINDPNGLHGTNSGSIFKLAEKWKERGVEININYQDKTASALNISELFQLLVPFKSEVEVQVTGNEKLAHEAALEIAFTLLVNFPMTNVLDFNAAMSSEEITKSTSNAAMKAKHFMATLVAVIVGLFIYVKPDKENQPESDELGTLKNPQGSVQKTSSTAHLTRKVAPGEFEKSEQDRWNEKSDEDKEIIRKAILSKFYWRVVELLAQGDRSNERNSFESTIDLLKSQFDFVDSVMGESETTDKTRLEWLKHEVMTWAKSSENYQKELASLYETLQIKHVTDLKIDEKGFNAIMMFCNPFEAYGKRVPDVSSEKAYDILNELNPNFSKMPVDEQILFLTDLTYLKKDTDESIAALQKELGASRTLQVLNAGYDVFSYMTNPLVLSSLSNYKNEDIGPIISAVQTLDKYRLGTRTIENLLQGDSLDDLYRLRDLAKKDEKKFGEAVDKITHQYPENTKSVLLDYQRYDAQGLPEAQIWEQISKTHRRSDLSNDQAMKILGNDDYQIVHRDKGIAKSVKLVSAAMTTDDLVDEDGRLDMGVFDSLIKQAALTTNKLSVIGLTMDVFIDQGHLFFDPDQLTLLFIPHDRSEKLNEARDQVQSALEYAYIKQFRENLEKLLSTIDGYQAQEQPYMFLRNWTIHRKSMVGKKIIAKKIKLDMELAPLISDTGIHFNTVEEVVLANVINGLKKYIKLDENASPEDLYNAVRAYMTAEFYLGDLGECISAKNKLNQLYIAHDYQGGYSFNFSNRKELKVLFNLYRQRAIDLSRLENIKDALVKIGERLRLDLKDFFQAEEPSFETAEAIPVTTEHGIHWDIAVNLVKLAGEYPKARIFLKHAEKGEFKRMSSINNVITLGVAQDEKVNIRIYGVNLTLAEQIATRIVEVLQYRPEDQFSQLSDSSEAMAGDQAMKTLGGDDYQIVPQEEVLKRFSLPLAPQAVSGPGFSRNNNIIVSFARRDDGLIYPIYNSSLMFKSTRSLSEDWITQINKWNDFRKAYIVPLKIIKKGQESLELMQSKKSKDFEFMPQEIRDVLEGGMFVTDSKTSSEYSLWMAANDRSVFNGEDYKMGGRVGVLLKNGIPIIIRINGKEFLVEIKGIGSPEGGFHEKSDYYIGGMTNEQADKEFDHMEILREKDKSFGEALSPRSVFASTYMDSRLGLQGFIVRLVPGTWRSSYELLRNKVGFLPPDAILKKVHDYAREQSSLIPMGLVAYTHIENLLYVSPKDGYKLIDFADVIPWETFPLNVDKKIISLRQAIELNITSVREFKEFDITKHWEIFKEGYIAGLGSLLEDKEKDELQKAGDMETFVYTAWNILSQKVFVKKVESSAMKATDALASRAMAKAVNEKKEEIFTKENFVPELIKKNYVLIRIKNGRNILLTLKKQISGGVLQTIWIEAFDVTKSKDGVLVGRIDLRIEKGGMVSLDAAIPIKDAISRNEVNAPRILDDYSIPGNEDIDRRRNEELSKGLWVEQNLRKNFIGSLLFIGALGFLKSNKFNEMEIHTTLQAVPFYLRFGFDGRQLIKGGVLWNYFDNLSDLSGKNNVYQILKGKNEQILGFRVDERMAVDEVKTLKPNGAMKATGALASSAMANDANRKMQVKKAVDKARELIPNEKDWDNDRKWIENGFSKEESVSDHPTWRHSSGFKIKISKTKDPEALRLLLKRNDLPIVPIIAVAKNTSMTDSYLYIEMFIDNFESAHDWLKSLTGERNNIILQALKFYKQYLTALKMLESNSIDHRHPFLKNVLYNSKTGKVLFCDLKLVKIQKGDNLQYLKTTAFFISLLVEGFPLDLINGLSDPKQIEHSIDLLIKENSQAMSSAGGSLKLNGPGGIDLTSKEFVETQNAGEGIKFHMNPAMLAQLQNAPGFYPVIINIEPLNDLKGFLGIENSHPEIKTAML